MKGYDSLVSSLESFFSTERLSGENKYSCEVGGREGR